MREFIIVAVLFVFASYVYLRVRQTTNDLDKCTKYFGENIDEDVL